MIEKWNKKSNGNNFNFNFISSKKFISVLNISFVKVTMTLHFIRLETMFVVSTKLIYLKVFFTFFD